MALANSMNNGPSRKFEDYSVTVNGQPVFVFEATVNRSAAAHGIEPETVGFATFDFSGEARVTVTARQDLQSVTVRPQSLSITPALQDGIVSFTISQPCKLCLESNGSDRRPLFLFANALESYAGGVPQSGQEKVRYFGPGVHEAGEIRPQSGETIYLAGGALVYGKIAATGVRGVRILGRGILDGSKWKQWETSLIALTDCSDVEIRGVILRDAPAWTVVPHRCDRITVADVKILNYRKNSDGINSVNCRNVTVEDCFVQSTMAGFDADHCVEDVTFENLRIHGKLISSTVEGQFQTNEHVKNVRFLPGK